MRRTGTPRKRSLRPHGIVLIAAGLALSLAALLWWDGAGVEADPLDAWSLGVLAWAALVLGAFLAWQR